MRRAHSVGIRKILGASRLALGVQFLGEAVLFSLLAVLIGVVIVEVALRFTSINSLMGQQVSLDLAQHPALLAALLGLGVVMGLLSGIYPAFYLSSWAPLSALRQQECRRQGQSGGLREGLVLLQFTISVAVIACTLLMGAQMRYASPTSPWASRRRIRSSSSPCGAPRRSRSSARSARNWSRTHTSWAAPRRAEYRRWARLPP